MADIPPDRAVIDQIVDGTTALLLVGPGETPLHVDAGTLPDGAGEGIWLILDVQSTPPLVVGIDQELTDSRAADVQDRMERLRRERGSGRFGR